MEEEEPSGTPAEEPVEDTADGDAETPAAAEEEETSGETEETAVKTEETTEEETPEEEEDLQLFGEPCGDDMTWSFNEGTGVLTISGSGEMDNYDISSDWCDIWFIYNNDSFWIVSLPYSFPVSVQHLAVLGAVHPENDQPGHPG